MPDDLDRDRRLKAAHGIAYQGLAAFAKYQADAPTIPDVTYRRRADLLNEWVCRQGMLFVEQIDELDIYDKTDQDPKAAHQFISDMGLIALMDLKWSLSPKAFAAIVASVLDDYTLQLIQDAHRQKPGKPDIPEEGCSEWPG